MRFCQVGLLVTLGMTAVLSLRGQTLAAGPVLVASESLPGSSGFFPEVLTASRSLPTLPTPPEASPAPLTGKDRLMLFWNESYANPGAFVGVAAGAWVDQVRHTPAKWDGDGSGYTRRFASEYGQLATRNAIHDGLAALTGLDPRYVPCKCQGTLRRGAHALIMSATTYRQDGRLVLDVPELASAYGSGMISTYWYPHHQFSPLAQGVQFGNEQMGEVVVNNLVREFGPDIQHRLHLKSLTAHRASRPDDDD